MTQSGPMDLESMASDVPVNVKGREVDPDVDEKVAPNMEKISDDEHMNAILEHVPEALKERVSKITRTELAMPGMPRDREAYDAYCFAEKMLRDQRRREDKKNFSWNGLPRQNG